MIREITPKDNATHVYDDTHTMLVCDPDLIRLHHKVCGGVILTVPLVNGLDMQAILASFSICQCRKTSALQQHDQAMREQITAEIYAYLYKRIRATCVSADDVIRLLEHLSSPSRQEANYAG